MLWRTSKLEPFIPKVILSFATANGWKLVDSATYTKNRTDNWKYLGKPVFPLTSAGFSDTLTNDDILRHFPRWFEGPIRVYKFTTGWITISPGTDNSIEENGFVLLNEDMTEMAVYHLWGE